MENKPLTEEQRKEVEFLKGKRFALVTGEYIKKTLEFQSLEYLEGIKSVNQFFFLLAEVSQELEKRKNQL